MWVELMSWVILLAPQKGSKPREARGLPRPWSGLQESMLDFIDFRSTWNQCLHSPYIPRCPKFFTNPLGKDSETWWDFTKRSGLSNTSCGSHTVVQICSGLSEAPAGCEWRAEGRAWLFWKPMRIFSFRKRAFLFCFGFGSVLGSLLLNEPQVISWHCCVLSGCLPFPHANSNLEGDSN